MNILVGYTGFVGSNLYKQHKFDGFYNSKNIVDAFGLNPDLCVYAGIRAEKFLANNNPKADMDVIENAIENIKHINPKRLVLISTIDVFKAPYNCDENTPVQEEGLHAYGYNRYQLEKWCAENTRNIHILRLPGLFGANIKKNFIYDLIHILPSTLNESKFNVFSENESNISSYYIKQENGFYVLKSIVEDERINLIEVFQRLDFSALNFTDSRAIFQFYNLDYLWEHIKFAIKNETKLLHLAVEPISVNELYYAVNNKEFSNEIASNPPFYNFKTIYASRLNGVAGYIFDKHQVISEIKEFIANEPVC